MNWDMYADKLGAIWNSLDPITRAERIDCWVKGGNSVRKLGKKLHLAESGLRKIRALLDLSAQEREKVRSGRSQAVALKSPIRKLPETEVVVVTVRTWMEREGIAECDRARVIEDVEWRLESLNTPEKIESARSKVGAIDLKKRPSYVRPDDLGMINGWILWLARYLVKFDGWRDIITELKQQQRVETP